MPWDQLDKIAQSHGIAVALLLAACVIVAAVAVGLWRENRALHGRIEALLQERSVLALRMLIEVSGDRRAQALASLVAPPIGGAGGAASQSAADRG